MTEGTSTPAAEPASHHAHYLRGVALVLAGGVCLSGGGLLLRGIEAADGWQILFYRSLAFFVTLFTYLVLRYRGRVVQPFRAVGWSGVIAALALGVGFVCYVYAMLLTTVANVVFTLAAGPFLAAGLAWLVLRERVRPGSLVAMVAAVAGIGLMFGDGLQTGRWLGNLVALVPPATFAVLVVAFRFRKDIDMVPATCLAGLVSLLIAAWMVEDLSVSSWDLMLSLLLGSVQVGAGFLLITLGARYVPAGEVSLFGLTETILAPLWVGLVIGEVPSLLTLAGGVVVMVAVVGAAASSLRAHAAASPGNGVGRVG
jgi:drug/metabolite transporter (DMT)-like permease